MPRKFDPIDRVRGSAARREADRRRRADNARRTIREASSMGANMHGEFGGDATVDTLPEADQDFLGQTFYIDSDNENETTRVVQLQRNGNGGFNWKDMLNDEGEWNAPFILEWGSQGTGNGQFDTEIRDIAINPANGDVFVSSDNRIQKFTANGTYVSTFAVSGSSNGQVNTPKGISFDPITGNLHIADYGNHRVQEITAAGVFVRTYRRDSSAVPVSVAAGFTSGYAYEFRVLNENPSELHGFNPAFSYINYTTLEPMSGVTKLAKRHLYGPDTFGNWLVVTFQDWDEVAVYDIGAFGFGATPYPPRIRIGGLGSAPGQFNGPDGIAIDAQSNLLIVDSGNHRVQVFSGSGIFQGKWGKAGNGDGEFNNPTAIAVTDDYIYVADSGNYRIQIFANPVAPAIGEIIVLPFQCAGGSNASAVTWLNTLNESVILPKGTWEITTQWNQVFTGVTAATWQCTGRILSPDMGAAVIANSTSTGRASIHASHQANVASNGITPLVFQVGFVRSGFATTPTAESGNVLILCKRIA